MSDLLFTEMHNSRIGFGTSQTDSLLDLMKLNILAHFRSLPRSTPQQAWLLGRPVADRQPLFNLFEQSFPQTHRFVVQNLNVKMDYHEAFFAHQALSILTGLLPSDMQVSSSGVFRV